LQFGLVLGHRLLGLTRLLFLLEQRLGASARLIRIHSQLLELPDKALKGAVALLPAKRLGPIKQRLLPAPASLTALCNRCNRLVSIW
jgi:hypothetical protein